MRRALLALALLAPACVTPPAGEGFQERTARRAGLELRMYPAGLQLTATSLWPTGAHDAWHVGVGANVTDRGDWGEHDDEEGAGSGVGGGWRRYAGADRLGFFWGARADIWTLDIDWEEDSGDDGTSTVLVLQPTGELGYAWLLGGPWVLETGVGLGVEWNVDTDGEDVGEGPILLGGVAVSAGF